MENCPSGSISLSTNNGTITGDHGHYHILPDHLGCSVIWVHKKTAKGTTIIDSAHFKVKLIPTVLSFGGKGGGVMDKASLCVMLAPTVDIEAPDVGCGRFLIDSFSISVLRQNKEIYNKSIGNPKGARIDTATNHFFKTLEILDQVIIYNVRTKYCSGHEYFQPGRLVFTIIKSENYNNNLNDYYQTPVNDPITGEEVLPRKN